MNSMHGFWIALAWLDPGSWFRSTWWPYWMRHPIRIHVRGERNTSFPDED